jgi:hypothetical protein
MLNFLNSFDNTVLKETYIKVFYYYANEVGKNITLCIKPSFKRHFGHLEPYYKRSELINLALNMDLIKPDLKFYDNKKLLNLCSRVKENDISANIIEEHQNHIILNNKIGIVQYYSLQGSYYMNTYLRNQMNYETQNIFLEEQINSMNELINNCPSYDKNYILYRFIKNDEHISNLKIGDQYIPESFLSTTRDPFYQSEDYKFGFILIKIKIPKDIKGIALCIETISLFPKEEEIILAPNSILKLEKKDSNVKYYHPDYNYSVKITTKYEFSYTGRKKLYFEEKPQSTNTLIDFLDLPKTNSISVEEKIKAFSLKYINEKGHINTKIGNEEYTIICETYDSTNVYRPFYANKTENGFMLYSVKNNYIVFTIEIGEDDNGSFIFVNYYLKYSVSLQKKPFSKEDFIKFISSIGNYFNIKTIIIYADYLSCDLTIKDEYYGGNYCVDIYKYLKYNKRQFSEFDTTEIKPKFNYFLLDKLETINPMDILEKHDSDEIRTIYKNIYKLNIKDQKFNNLKYFYIWLLEKYCHLIPILTKKMFRIFKQDNPFENDYYILDPNIYLYNRGIIQSYNFEQKPIIPNVIKNNYRLNTHSRIKIMNRNKK